MASTAFIISIPLLLSAVAAAGLYDCWILESAFRLDAAHPGIPDAHPRARTPARARGTRDTGSPKARGDVDELSSVGLKL